MKTTVRLIIAFFVVHIFATVAGAAENTLYKKMLVKSRAQKYESTDGVSPASRDLYIYADDKDIEASIGEIKRTPRAVTGKSVNIVSPVIGKKSKVRNINIAVDAKKGIKIDKDRLGLKDEDEINIASPVIDAGAKVRDINVTIDAGRKGIEIK